MNRRFVLVLLALLLFFAGCAGPEAAPAAAPERLSLRYEPNGAPGEAVTVSVPRTHLRVNTEQGELFSREGHTLYAWNTEPDGSGLAVGLGSRVDPVCTTLYAQWAPWSEESLFTVEDGVLTAYTGDETVVTVPGLWRGQTVRSIGEDAFRDCPARTVILPPTLKALALGAFRNAALEELYLFDSIQNVTDYAFEGCEALRTLHLNASIPPVYAGSYYATFADKYDRLVSLAGKRKLVLFSGSSARFGYDSAAIDRALPDYEVVNMGVFAYTNALPQLELIRAQLRPGDLLLLSPELDAAQRQFCTTNALDSPYFNLMEANYDMLAALDLRDYTRVFSSLSEYLSVKRRMEGRSYADSPADYDEDGNPVSQPSYNAYGDYILYRPNADTDTPIYGLQVPYTAAFYRKEQYIDPLNRELRRFASDGIYVYLTYAPRNRLAVSADSDEAAIRGLDRYFREALEIPVISDVFDSLVDGRYLYGTDNHLSTEGVQRRTAQIIRDLSAQLQADGLPAAAAGEWGTVRLRPPERSLWLSLYALALPLLWLGVRRRRLSALAYLAGFLWVGATLAALVGGAALTEVLLCTLPLLLAAACAGKRGEAV